MLNRLRPPILLLSQVSLLVALSTARGFAERVIEVQPEKVATCADPQNGSGPLWCYGAPLVVRQGDVVYVSVMEVGQNVKPLCNTTWRIFQRNEAGWSEIWRPPPGYRNREPCPIVLLAPDRLMVSVNPTAAPAGTHYGPCVPGLHLIDPRRPKETTTHLALKWSGNPQFTDHSYRGISVDSSRGEALVLNIDATTGHQQWSYQGFGSLSSAGEIQFPVRTCYPLVHLHDRSASIFGVADTPDKEPFATFKKANKLLPYGFRRLFYATITDVKAAGAVNPIEIANVEQTGGALTNLDLWCDARGVLHLLYLKVSTEPGLRAKFFPDERIRQSLVHVSVNDKMHVSKHTMLQDGGEAKVGTWGETPVWGRFHATRSGKLFVVYSVAKGDPGDAGAAYENRISQLLPETTLPVTLPFSEAFRGAFFTATERGGSAPSAVLDMFGSGQDDNTLNYARVRLE